MKSLLKKIPAPFQGELIPREEPCRVCNAVTGTRIGVADYWDIRTSGIVMCGACGHIQLDPMLNEEETALGCRAYYMEELQRTGNKEVEKNCERNFRRGVVFGYKLKRRNFTLQTALELGPGSGYFSAGLQFVFPGLKITVMDINRDVLALNEKQHDFQTIEAVPDTFAENCTGRFDLVVARDILEHVTDISKVLDNIYRYLKPGGLFHFITPNGHEDVWKHYLAWKIAGTPSELLINHVNYFDGKSLGFQLQQKGMRSLDYYTYKVKYTLRGSGWKKDRRLMGILSQKKSAESYAAANIDIIPGAVTDKMHILNKWYILPDNKLVTWLYCLYHHFLIIRLPAEANVGHEIYGLFEKKQQVPGGFA